MTPSHNLKYLPVEMALLAVVLLHIFVGSCYGQSYQLMNYVDCGHTKTKNKKMINCWIWSAYDCDFILCESVNEVVYLMSSFRRQPSILFVRD